MNNWTYQNMMQELQKKEAWKEQTQAARFETMQNRYLELKYRTHGLDHRYKAICHVTRALYMHTSVLLSVNIVVAIEEIQLCIELMRKEVYYDYLLPVYETALQELRTIQAIQEG